jgi:effector-binding domain-containing protein
MPRKKMIIASIVILALIIGFVAWGPISSMVEQPKYTVTLSEGDIELRTYSPVIVAEVIIAGNRKEAISDGFRQLADYIFGNNTTSSQIAMTAPVQQEPSEKIAMTAPVQQQASGDDWKIRFVMPSQYTMDSIPKPNNKAVRLIEVPEKKYVAIRFSGSNTDENISSNEKRLLNYIEDKKLKIVGKPIYAFYNPPWTLPFLRRNEVFVEIAD